MSNSMPLEMLHRIFEFLMDMECYSLADEVCQEIHERETIRDLILDHVER